jgi:hypothetical protein
MISMQWSVGMSHNAAGLLTTLPGFHPMKPFGAFPKGFIGFIDFTIQYRWQERHG